MKIFTHVFKVTIFEEGRFCWKNARFEKNNDSRYFVDVLLFVLALYAISDIATNTLR